MPQKILLMKIGHCRPLQTHQLPAALNLSESGLFILESDLDFKRTFPIAWNWVLDICSQ